MKTKSYGERPDISTGKGGKFSDIDISTLVRYSFSTKYLKSTYTSLDIGCGYGHGVFLQSFWAKSSMGVDIDREALNYARKFHALQNVLNTKFQLSSNLAQLNEVYDLVTAFEIIEHVDKKTGIEIIDVVTRKLSNNGVFVISTPYIDLRGKTYWRFHKHEYYSFELKKILKRYFNHVETYYQLGDGAAINSGWISLLAKNPVTSVSTVLFVCSNSSESIKNRKERFWYQLCRGMYRNVKYLIKN